MNPVPSFEALLLERRGRVLRIVLNRPEVLNAFGQVMHREMIEALQFASADPGSDILVLTGAGRAFSAGGDLARMEECIADPREFEREANRVERKADRRDNVVTERLAGVSKAAAEGVTAVSNRVEETVQVGVAAGERIATRAKGAIA